MMGMRMLLLTLLILTSCLSARVDKYFYGSGLNSSSLQPYKEAVADTMKDPDSVKFRRMKFYKPVKDGRRIIVLCGEFNAKNSMGGYTGYDYFVTNGIYSDTPPASGYSRTLALSVVECLCHNSEIPIHCD